jgi:hypothetical protein
MDNNPLSQPIDVAGVCTSVNVGKRYTMSIVLGDMDNSITMLETFELLILVLFLLEQTLFRIVNFNLKQQVFKSHFQACSPLL